MLLRQFYNIVLTLLSLPAALYLRFHAPYRKLLGRFSPKIPEFTQRPIWIQAASLGEVNTAQPLLEAIQKQWPDVPILLTTSTVSGMQQAQSVSVYAQLSWFPFDHPSVVRRFLTAANPRCLLLIETELWPNVLHYSRREGIPVIIVNGRISAKHFSRYIRAHAFFAPLLSPVSLACMQTQLDADRINQLGVKSENTTLSGNIKFDGASTQINENDQLALRNDLGIMEHRPILVFGSTRPGDEVLALDCWNHLKDEFPDLFLVIAPRHTKRIQEALDPFKNEDVLLRSEIRSGAKTPGSERVLFVDTMGELGLFYSLATVAVVGGSFSDDVQGHNPIEPAALAVPTVFGPHMKNFLGPAEILTQAHGAIQVQTSDELLPVIRNLLQSADARDKVGRLGQAAVIENRGAIQKTIEHLDAFVLGS